MNLRKLHKYISLVVSLQLLLWTVSGIYFSFNKIENVRGEQYYKAEKAPVIVKPTAQEKLSQESVFEIITQQTVLKPITIELVEEPKKGSEYRGRDLPLYKVLAESALRAIKLCQPLRVPTTGYERWKDLQLNFDAREMLEG